MDQQERAVKSGLGLPSQDRMQQVSVAFDVDGTLISNLDDTPNYRIVNLLIALAHMKNVNIFVWSGGGCDYAGRWVERLGLKPYVRRAVCKVVCEHCFELNPDIAIDDVQSTAIGKINLIVREK